MQARALIVSCSCHDVVFLTVACSSIIPTPSCPSSSAYVASTNSIDGSSSPTTTARTRPTGNESHETDSRRKEMHTRRDNTSNVVNRVIATVKQERSEKSERLRAITADEHQPTESHAHTTKT